MATEVEPAVAALAEHVATLAHSAFPRRSGNTASRYQVPHKGSRRLVGAGHQEMNLLARPFTIRSAGRAAGARAGVRKAGRRRAALWRTFVARHRPIAAAGVLD